MADGPTIDSYFTSFAPGMAWDELCAWPPDVFALANLVLDQTEAYRFAVAPPAGRAWPPARDWDDQVVAAAREWRDTAGRPGRGAPGYVRHNWDTVAARRHLPLGSLRAGSAVEVTDALITLHAMADEACRGLASSPRGGAPGLLERRAWSLLERRGSVSRINPARIRITPKTHFAVKGITIRSFSRYLALNYEAVEVGWRRLLRAGWAETDRRELNLVLLPWPLALPASAFRPVTGPLENMPSGFGFFEFDPGERVDLHLIEGIVSEARRKVGHVHAVVLPEDALAADELVPVERAVADLGVDCLLTGVRAGADGPRMGRNLVHFGARTGDGWVHYQQAKHHRWCLDEAQIRQYHLCGALDPAKLWWESIDLPVRTAQVVDVGGATIAPLICEDLARLDEVADVLRRVGPSLVVGLLLDGPQLPQRWPARYATVLADEPGSAVLTLTSFGMVARSRPKGRTRSRAVALWSAPGAGLRQLDLAPGAKGIAITLSVGTDTVWTADGRCHHDSTPVLNLRRVEQLYGRTG